MRFVTYTHSKLKDIWPIYIDRLNKFAPDIPNVFFCDQPVLNQPTVIYDDNQPYSQHYAKCLKSIDDKYVIYMQEDFILYNHIDTKKIESYAKILDSHYDVDYIRLIKCGFVGETKFADTLYEVQNPELDPIISTYSMQPTIWKRDRLVSVYDDSNAQKVFNEYAMYQGIVKNGIVGLYHYDQERVIGDHCDSKVFPYIATALVKGKWNIHEYTKELNEVAREYNVDLTVRGFYEKIKKDEENETNK